jgi:hypothetical protein
MRAAAQAARWADVQKRQNITAGRNAATADAVASSRASCDRARWQEFGSAAWLRCTRRGTEARHRTAPNGQVSRDAWNQGAGLRHLDDLINCGIDRIEELDAQVLPSLFIPPTSKAVLGVSFVLKTNERIHLRRSSASARRRTSSHGTPVVSPAITRRARRSISAAHAASTSAGSSVAASSRLARSWAATSARSSKGNASASRRSSCARGDMGPFYTREPQPNIALEPSTPARA